MSLISLQIQSKGDFLIINFLVVDWRLTAMSFFSHGLHVFQKRLVVYGGP